jgi:3-hydroxyisobutyryl-CoA hydrolase
LENIEEKKRFMQDKDFFEGVRCTLVDKKDKPKWKYKTPFDMSDEEVEKYFSKLPEKMELRLE